MEVHRAGLMADLKAVMLVHVMIAQLAKSTVEITNDKRD